MVIEGICFKLGEEDERSIRIVNKPLRKVLPLGIDLVLAICLVQRLLKESGS